MSSAFTSPVRMGTGCRSQIAVVTVTASPSKTQSGRHESFPSFRSIDIILALFGLGLGLTNTLFGSFLRRRAGSHQAAFEEELRQLVLSLILFNFGHSSTSSRHRAANWSPTEDGCRAGGRSSGR